MPLSPGTTTAPASLPSRSALRLSSRRPASLTLAPWHSWHLATRSGRTFDSKLASASRDPRSAAAAGKARARLVTSVAVAAETAAAQGDSVRDGETHSDMQHQSLRAKTAPENQTLYISAVFGDVNTRGADFPASVAFAAGSSLSYRS